MGSVVGRSGRAVAAAALAVIASACDGRDGGARSHVTERTEHTADGEGVEDRDTTVLELEREGGYPWHDDELIDQVAGDVGIDPLFATAVDCANGADWEDEHSLDRSVLLSTRADLVTAARLIATGRVRPDVAREVEDAFWQTGADIQAVAAAVAELDPEPRELAEAYIDARAEAPSEEATGRYGVYVVGSTIWVQYVVYFDAAALDGDEIEEYVDHGLPREIRRPDGTGGLVAVPLESCEDVLERWHDD